MSTRHTAVTRKTSTPPTAHAAPSPEAAVHPTAVSSSRYEKNRASAPQRAPLVLNGYSRLVQRNDNGDGIAGERRPVPHHFGRVGSQQRSLLTLTHSSPAFRNLFVRSLRVSRFTVNKKAQSTCTLFASPPVFLVSLLTRGQCKRGTVFLPVKRHRGEPGHTRDTYGTRGRTRAHGSHRRTSHPHTGK